MAAGEADGSVARYGRVPVNGRPARDVRVYYLEGRPTLLAFAWADDPKRTIVIREPATFQALVEPGRGVVGVAYRAPGAEPLVPAGPDPDDPFQALMQSLAAGGVLGPPAPAPAPPPAPAVISPAPPPAVARNVAVRRPRTFWNPPGDPAP